MFDYAGAAETSTSSSLRRWFAFETTIGPARYCYHQREWYRIGEGFVEQIHTQVAKLLTQRSDLTFPEWIPTRKRNDEHKYCELAAEQTVPLPGPGLRQHTVQPSPGTVRPRRPWRRTRPREMARRATAASHLYTQALSAADSLREEPQALEQLRENVERRDPRRTNTTPSAFVLAIADRPWAVNQLFAMSQISLLRLDRAMHQLRMRLEFAEIPHIGKATAKRPRDAA